MRTPRLARCIAAAGLGLALLAAPTLASAAPAPRTAPTAPAAKEDPPPSSELGERQRQYAQRQAASPQAADFEGNGVGIYVGGSTLAVVLVIVLIVVLL